MNKRDLMKRVARRMDISQDEACLFMDTFEEVFMEAVSEVNITWKGLGSFRRIRQTERPGRNPLTGVPAIVPARTTLKFRPSPLLLEYLNAEPAPDKDGDRLLSDSK